MYFLHENYSFFWMYVSLCPHGHQISTWILLIYPLYLNRKRQSSDEGVFDSDFERNIHKMVRIKVNSKCTSVIQSLYHSIWEVKEVFKMLLILFKSCYLDLNASESPWIRT